VGTGAEVAVTGNTGDALVEITPEQAQLAYAVLRGEVVPEYSPEEMARVIAERIARADSQDELDALFTPADERKLPGWSELLMGVPVRIEALRFNPSAFTEGSDAKVYAVVDVTRADTGERVTVHTGGQSVMFMCVKIIERKDTLGKRLFRMVTTKAHSGYDVLQLEYADTSPDADADGDD
jgi:hypothetical protein